MYINSDWREYYGPGLYPVPGVYGGFPGVMPGPGYPPATGYPAGVPYGPTQQMAQFVLNQVQPLVQYAAYEQTVEKGTLPHTILEVAAIAYVMGRYGLPFQQARRIVETWEMDEKFPGFEY